MQQTKSYWRVVAALGVVGAFVASACVVTTSTDNGTGGDAGETNTTAGSTSAGGASAGTTSTAGTTSSGGDQPTDYQCDSGDAGAPPGTPSTCAPDDAHKTDSCALCVQSSCCAEYSACFATDPGNQCGWGGPNDGSEILCFQQCVKDAITAGGVYDADTVTMCSGQCATSTDNHSTHDCGQLPGIQTNALISCLHDNCSVECFGG